MAIRTKTGGRQKGTPNKRSQDAAERLAALGCDPLEGLAKIAMDEDADLALRARIYMELAQYLYPKRKAAESSGTSGLSIEDFLMQLPPRSFGKAFNS